VQVTKGILRRAFEALAGDDSFLDTVMEKLHLSA
jgi:hypothetical protein